MAHHDDHLTKQLFFEPSPNSAATLEERHAESLEWFLPGPEEARFAIFGIHPRVKSLNGFDLMDILNRFE